jgi:hypothetical protein
VAEIIAKRNAVAEKPAQTLLTEQKYKLLAYAAHGTVNVAIVLSHHQHLVLELPVKRAVLKKFPVLVALPVLAVDIAFLLSLVQDNQRAARSTRYLAKIMLAHHILGRDDRLRNKNRAAVNNMNLFPNSRVTSDFAPVHGKPLQRIIMQKRLDIVRRYVAAMEFEAKIVSYLNMIQARDIMVDIAAGSQSRKYVALERYQALAAAGLAYYERYGHYNSFLQIRATPMALI